MNILIDNHSMIPIYEQIVDQIKIQILKGNLQENEILASVRSLSKELKISALTVKKAYDILEQDGYIVTVHGKGSFVNKINKSLKSEEQHKEVEDQLISVIKKAKHYDIKKDEFLNLLDILWEE